MKKKNDENLLKELWLSFSCILMLFFTSVPSPPPQKKKTDAKFASGKAKSTVLYFECKDLIYIFTGQIPFRVLKVKKKNGMLFVRICLTEISAKEILQNIPNKIALMSICTYFLQPNQKDTKLI